MSQTTVTAGRTTTPAVSAVVAAEEVAAAVLTCEGVVRLHAGRLGEVATLGPGRRVQGVRLAGDDAEVHVVVRYGDPVELIAGRVRAAVTREGVIPGSVHVVIEDVE